MAKADVKKAYRNVPVHPDDRRLLGMEWRGTTFVDRTLPFGLRSAPLLFTALGDALEWVAKAHGAGWLCHSGPEEANFKWSGQEVGVVWVWPGFM